MKPFTTPRGSLRGRHRSMLGVWVMALGLAAGGCTRERPVSWQGYAEG